MRLSAKPRSISLTASAVLQSQAASSAADLHALTVMGCDFGQGALIAPAMPRERFLDLLRQRVSAAKPAADVETDKAAAQPAATSIGRVA
jgi:hypothetical protein